MSTLNQQRACAIARESKTTNQALSNGVNSQLPNAYFNAPEPSQTLLRQREKPEHRLWICLKANGFSNVEIAEREGVACQTVSIVLRQPWAQARIIAMQQEAGMDELQRTLKVGCSGAVARILKRAENMDVVAPALAQRVDEYIVDRYLGKASQTIEHVTKPVVKMTDAELADVIRKYDVEQSNDGVVGQVELEHEGVGAQ
jgi:lambda repressor-like predicted transcriptional regulator